MTESDNCLQAAARLRSVVIVVPDLEEAKAFFVSGLGFHLSEQLPDSDNVRRLLLGLSGNEDECRLELREYRPSGNRAADPDTGVPNRPGFRHLAFWVDGDIEEYLNGVSERLRALQFDAGSLQLFPYRQKRLCYFTGPAGILLELMQDPEYRDVACSGPPRIRCIDHLNIVTKDLALSAKCLEDIGFVPVKGKAGRLQGKWIDELTGLTNVDAEYVALQGNGGPVIELIRYDSPRGVSDDAIQDERALGIRQAEAQAAASGQGVRIRGPENTIWMLV